MVYAYLHILYMFVTPIIHTQIYKMYTHNYTLFIHYQTEHSKAMLQSSGIVDKHTDVHDQCVPQ